MKENYIKGVLLAGGTGSRLGQLTRVTNKHLLPIYNKPMIFYPLSTLIDLGIKEILIVTSIDFCGHISQLLGSGKEYNVEFSYKVQDEAGGIAQALSLAENFSCGSNVNVILGDNIFAQKFNASSVANFNSGAKVFLSKTDNPERFGVANIIDGKLVGIEEKPKKPKSNFAVTGMYLYDNSVFDRIKQIKPSKRNELEITDVNNLYIDESLMSYEFLTDEWTDAGTFESLFKANQIARNCMMEGKMNLAATKEISIFEENRTIAINIYDQPEYISNILQINKEFYEFYVLRYIKKMYPKHNTIVDVGANIGNHAKYFTNFLEHELIYCFEPYVANYNLLKKNIADQKVIAYNCALGAIRGKCKIIEPKENNSGMIKVVDGNDVDIMPLDNFNIENVTLIKIDVEGAEYNVLLGAMRTILKYRPPIFIETNDEKVFELMDLIGYKIGKRFYEGDAVSGDLATIEFIHEANKDAH